MVFRSGSSMVALDGFLFGDVAEESEERFGLTRSTQLYLFCCCPARVQLNWRRGWTSAMPWVFSSFTLESLAAWLNGKI